MKAFPRINFTESTRQKLASVLFVTHIVTVLTSFMIIAIGLYIKIKIESKIRLTAGYNSAILPWVIFGVGFLNLIVCLVGVILCKLTRNVEKRNKIRSVQLPYVYFALYSAICVFVVAMLILSHMNTLHYSFDRGLIVAMRRYKYEHEVKVEIDELQMYYRCCGSRDYNDWFNVSWMSDDFLNKHLDVVERGLINGHYYNDDVPFSCCNPKSLRPCIINDVKRDDMHYSYIHKQDLTLYEDGCRDILMNYFSKILLESTIVILFFVIIELSNIVGMRFLQTSIYLALDRGHPELIAPGWLIGSMNEQPLYANLRDQQYRIDHPASTAEYDGDGSFGSTFDDASDEAMSRSDLQSDLPK